MVKEQTSVIRTNCMDCLDRTNVVQSTFARHVITKQLVEAGIFKETDRVDMFPDFESMFRNSNPTHSLFGGLTQVWADNANVVSKAYSGTGALKTDFTRTGKRSTMGLLQDGSNSVERYIRNNFYDVSRQVPVLQSNETNTRMRSILFSEIMNHGKPCLNHKYSSITDLYSSKPSPISYTHPSS